MEIDVSGDVSAASGQDISDLKSATLGSLVHSVNVGTDQLVLVYQNETDPTDNITEVRTIMSDDVSNGVWTYTGSVTPDTSNTEACIQRRCCDWRLFSLRSVRVLCQHSRTQYNG